MTLYKGQAEGGPRDSVLVSHIQRGALQDGPGWRTTVYLKGCPLRCPWCYNAESLHFQQELRYVPQFCIGAAACGRCLEACPAGGIVLAESDTGVKPVVRRQACHVCGACTDVCPSGALSLVGRAMTAADIVREAEKDRDFYVTSGGGLTLSGGEPLVRPALAAAVMSLARQKGLHTAIETCGWFDLDAPANRTALRNCDLLLFDLKHLDSRQHRAFTHMDNSRILENLDRIVREFPALPIWVRTPVVRGFNDNEADIRAMARHVAQLPTVVRHELLPCLPVGEEKYAQMGMVRSQLASAGPDSAQLRELRAIVAACRRDVHSRPTEEDHDARYR